MVKGAAVKVTNVKTRKSHQLRQKQKTKPVSLTKVFMAAARSLYETLTTPMPPEFRRTMSAAAGGLRGRVMRDLRRRDKYWGYGEGSGSDLQRELDILLNWASPRMNADLPVDLLFQGAGVNSPDPGMDYRYRREQEEKDGTQFYSVLHNAAAIGDAHLVSVFLDFGADPNRQSPSGDTPLRLAQQNGHENVAAMLQRAMASPYLRMVRQLAVTPPYSPGDMRNSRPFCKILPGPRG